jgi:hypothetical protein
LPYTDNNHGNPLWCTHQIANERHMVGMIAIANINRTRG